MRHKEIIPAKPEPRAEKTSILRHIRLFRKDIFASQPAKLYRAWMAEFRLPFFRSYFINDPELLSLVLKSRPDDFPKSDLVTAALRSLLGQSVFVTNGALWKRQRRIIDPAFEGGRLRAVYDDIFQAGQEGIARLERAADQGVIEIEEQCSRIAADVIFRTLFSIPITDEIAQKTFEKFRAYQRSQPLLNAGAMLRLPGLTRWVQRRRTREMAREIRNLLEALTIARARQIEAGTAPDDLATKIMTTRDPQTGERFSSSEMVDQVAIFFLAGHETSASALAWGLYLLALDPKAQAETRKEAQAHRAKGRAFSGLKTLRFTRNVFRETLRLYPPVPMMVRENKGPEVFRKRQIKRGSQIVLSPWHLHRHERIWQKPDAFDPARWEDPDQKSAIQNAYMPFSAGPRVCTGAGFAMLEGVLLLSMIAERFEITLAEPAPVPVAHLTVRAQNGIKLRLKTLG